MGPIAVFALKESFPMSVNSTVTSKTVATLSISILPRRKAPSTPPEMGHSEAECDLYLLRQKLRRFQVPNRAGPSSARTQCR
jgi:hypothetical protein